MGRALQTTALLLLASANAACRGLNVFTPEEDRELGRAAFQEVLAEERTIGSGPGADQVRRVTARLVEAVRASEPGIAAGFAWEVVLIDAPGTVNAFCLPGGYMAVYSGLLPVARDDAGLAVVMGHEIAHATRRHGTQRLTQALIQDGIFELARLALQGRGDPELLTQVGRLAVDQVFNLPYSRDQELQADKVGLFTMADAGYDPRASIEFWQRMRAASDGSPPELLSTHPSEANRIAELEKRLPEALARFEAARGGSP